jgi:hypothetical protein
MSKEDRFTQELLEAIGNVPSPFVIGAGISVLYELSVNQKGIVDMGVDFDSGMPIRGRGTGFQQDIVVYQEKTENTNTSIIPYLIAEVKFESVTTHDTIVYSYKASKIRRIYPYVRYGMILGGFTDIPGRVLRHGESFDFIVSLNYPFVSKEIDKFKVLVKDELATSGCMEDIRSVRRKIRVLQKRYDFDEAD